MALFCAAWIWESENAKGRKRETERERERERREKRGMTQNRHIKIKGQTDFQVNRQIQTKRQTVDIGHREGR